MADVDNNKSIIPLSQAVETIKTAILQGQYEANKDVNRIQLAVYFAIGKYLSKNTRNLEYGSGAIKAISDQLLREMPGLRGYSATNLKYMRLFYEAWKMLDANLSVATDESQSTIVIVASSQESSVATDECSMASMPLCASPDIAKLRPNCIFPFGRILTPDCHFVYITLFRHFV